MFRSKDLAFVDPIVSKTADFALLKKFADQAELDYSVTVAATYHKERVAKYEDSMQAWYNLLVNWGYFSSKANEKSSKV
jgi:hypothetical protein